MCVTLRILLTVGQRLLTLNILDICTGCLCSRFKLHCFVLFIQIRLLTSHVLSLFEQPDESDGSGRIIHWPIFSLCLSAELVPPTVHEYRNKLQHLENLDFTATHTYLLKYPKYNKVSIYFDVNMLVMAILTQ